MMFGQKAAIVAREFKDWRTWAWGLGLSLVLVLLIETIRPVFSTEKPLVGEPMVLMIALSNEPGIPEGWLDASTRPDMTDICNALIKNQSKEYANAISRARCIIKVLK